MSPDASRKKGLKLGQRKSQGPLPPGVGRRRRLRQERRQERLIQLWRLVFFLLTATGLSWLLLTLGWSLRSETQIKISGSKRMDQKVVVKAAGLWRSSAVDIYCWEAKPGMVLREALDKR